MSIVLFDLLSTQPVADTKFHGGGEYAKAVFQTLVNTLDNKCSQVHVCYDSSLYIDDWIITEIGRYNLIVHNVSSSEDIYALLSELASYEKVRFFAALSYSFTKPFPPNVYSIGTCHGLRTLEKPFDYIQLHYTSSMMTKLKLIVFQLLRGKKMQKYYQDGFVANFTVFDCIVVVSHHTEYAIRTYFPEESKKTQFVTYYTPAKDYDFSNIEVTDGGYILMISANRWLKNVYTGVRAIDDLYTKGLLVTVKTKVLGNLPESIKGSLKNKDRFDFLGYVDPEELEHYYSHCSVFLYPTLNEGFGLPPFEAMKYGKTCIISAVCSLPEIYGDAVYYCNPYDMAEIENRILCALDNRLDKALVDKQVKKILRKQQTDTLELCNLIMGRV